ncbi:hypothetical protein SAMN05443999_103101 [Roseovarius azorensis]|uniref:Uncharacterized protein n=1 Tax=Roseovarius azorensis TaxID=1287727 RepID=A0A1H7LPR6_9RHOB|nr:hypothetical protein [Roseovarius azorensis]SEL00718.1 hypothetical protein SAMN05443999_103101 [Roseovarius azorensis]
MVALTGLLRARVNALEGAGNTVAQSEDATPEYHLRRALRLFTGGTLVLASLGLWVVSSAPGDGAMMLIKLVISVTMLCLGLVFLIPRQTDDRPSEIQFDPETRQIRIIGPGMDADKPLVAVHDIDELAEVSLHDSVLTARDANGQVVVALHVADQDTQAALRRALDPGAELSGVRQSTGLV